jgi:hypothetical protein
MRLLVLGDVVGRAGRSAVLERLPGLVAGWRLDAVVVNGENAAGGFGITEAICRDLLDAGADVVTLGNHAFDQKEALVFIEREPRLVRPANFPPGTPGRGATLVKLRGGATLGVVNVLGRVHMQPLDDPFAALDRTLEEVALGRVADLVVADVHCEATSEKQALALHADGRATVVVGTHTHVPSADWRILPRGAAFATDIGMCGAYESIIGMEPGEPMHRFLRAIPSARFEPAEGPATLSGLAVEADPRSGLARAVFPVRLGGALAEAAPPWA